jgi:hypothetical protein
MANVIESNADIGWRNHQAAMKQGLKVVDKLTAAGHGHLAASYGDALSTMDTLHKAAHIMNRR